MKVMQDSCLLCLEEIKEESMPNLTGCQCNVKCHKHCIERWFQEKKQIECPICHVVLIPVVLLPIETVITRNQHMSRPHERSIGVCCCLLIGWAIAFAIVESVYS